MSRQRGLLVSLALVVLVIGGGIVAAQSGILGTTSGTVVWDAPNGPTIETTDIDVNESVPIRSGTVDFGHTSFNGSSSSSAELAAGGVSAGERVITDVDSGGSELVIDSDGIQAVGFNGTADSLTIRDVSLSDSSAEFETVNASGDLRITGLPTNATLTVFRSGSIDSIEQASSGELTLSVTGDETISLESTNAIQLTALQPDNRDLDRNPVELQADIDWRGFAAGESVTLNWSINGGQFTQTTVTSNGTYSVDVTESDGLAGGTNSWAVTANASVNVAPVSGSATFQTPDELEIRDELNPDQLVDNATVELTFFGEDDETVISRTATNGTVDMSGLPLDQELSLTAEAANYTSRTTYIPSIVEQQRVFLLPTNATVLETEFEVNDPTGTFVGDGARIEVRKPITINNSTKYRTVVGDRLGSAAFVTNLEQGARYSIKVFADGQQRELGPYEARTAQRVVLDISDVELGSELDLADTQDFTVRAQFLNKTVPVVEVAVLPDNTTIDTLEYRLYPQGNASQEMANESVLGLEGELVNRVAVPASVEKPALQNYILEYRIVVDGNEISGTEIIGSERTPLPLDGLPNPLVHAIGMGLVLLVGGLFSQANVGIGAISTSLVAGGLWFIGVLPPEVSGISIAVALMLGAMAYARSRGRAART